MFHNNIGAMTVLDADNYQVKWMMAGLGVAHDPDFLNDGKIVYFDNKWQRKGIAGSRIVEWDCMMHHPVWTFTAIDYLQSINKQLKGWQGFWSPAFGSQQRLPNGNYLITVSMGGNLIEITDDKNLVWKYVTTNIDNNSIGMLNKAERYTRDYLTFLNQ